MSKNGLFRQSRSRIKSPRIILKGIFLFCLCVIAALATVLPEQMLSVEHKSLKVQKVEMSFLDKFNGHMSKWFGSNEIDEIPPARVVTWNDLYALDLKTHKPSMQLQNQLSSEVSIKGFIIPMEFDEQRRIKELLLVPFIPSCMHVPPPPPNQMIHVKLHEGKKIENPFFPIEAVGHLKVAQSKFFEDQLTTSYEMDVRSLEVLTDSDMDPTRDFFGSILH